MNKIHRVVVTGLGAVTPLGISAKSSFAALLQNKSGLTKFANHEAFKCKIGGLIPQEFEEAKYETSMGKSLLFGVANAITMEALEDAGVLEDTEGNIIDRDHFGISLATLVGE